MLANFLCSLELKDSGFGFPRAVVYLTPGTRVNKSVHISFTANEVSASLESAVSTTAKNLERNWRRDSKAVLISGEKSVEPESSRRV